MTEPLFDVYLTGDLTSGTEPEQAAQRLARLFKTTPRAMSALLTGKPQLLKRGLTREVALKYRQALQPVGVVVAFRPQQVIAADPSMAAGAVAGTTTTTVERTVRPTTMARTKKSSDALTLAPAHSDLLRTEERSSLPVRDIDVSRLTLAPAGSDVLLPEERPAEVAAMTEPGAWSISEPGALLAPADSRPAPPVVATDHLQIVPTEGSLLRPDERRPPAPDYQLSEATGWQLAP